MSGEHVLICVAWPYANGPLHLGHVAGCYLPPDIQYRFERAMGNRVLMVSGSDEHGTPITVTAETQGITPQAVVDQYHEMNLKALLDLGCSWSNHLDPGAPNTVVRCLIGQAIQSTNAWCKKIFERWKPADSLNAKQQSNITRSMRTARAVFSQIDTSRGPVRRAAPRCARRPVRCMRRHL